jgi:hypothetical protein
MCIYLSFYGDYATGCMTKDRSLVPNRSKRFSLLQRAQTGSEIHPASYKIGTEGAVPPRVKPEHEADQFPLSGSEVKYAWNCTSALRCVFRA